MGPGPRSSRGVASGWFLRLFIIILTTPNENPVAISPPTNVPNRLPVNDKISIPRAVAASRKFTCKEPQQRAYHLRDLVHSMRLLNPSESANQPIYIVLKRCDGHSGCCMNPDMTCTPLTSHTYFEDVEIEVWTIERNESRRQWMTVEQHGKCSCQLTNYDERIKFENQKPNVTTVRRDSSHLR